jgi:hypothetical protein
LCRCVASTTAFAALKSRSPHQHTPSHITTLSSKSDIVTQVEKLTNVCPKVRRSLHPDRQIPINLANNFHRVINGEMRILR